MDMKILITGANGFLGYYLVRLLLEEGQEVLATGKGACRLPFEGRTGFQYQSLDFTDAHEVNRIIAAYQPQVIVHAGAMTKPDECEQDPEAASLVNITGTRIMLEAASSVKAHFVFISTDFIFDGEDGMYDEEAEGDPVNFYGVTKLEAEQWVCAWKGDWAIVRTVLVYGKPYDSRGNLLTFVTGKLQAGETIRIFDDQVRTPTWVEDLARGIRSVIDKRAAGIWHISGADVRTPYQIAVEVAELQGLDTSRIIKVTEDEFEQPAKRPLRTGFNITKARRELGFEPIGFAEGLKRSI